MIEVVSGVIVRNARLLLIQRRPDQSFPLTWVTPGGKVEGNESHHQALTRELVEEIGVTPVGFGQAPVWCGHPTPEDRECFVLLYWTDIGHANPPTPRTQWYRLVRLDRAGAPGAWPGGFSGSKRPHPRAAARQAPGRSRTGQTGLVIRCKYRT